GSWSWGSSGRGVRRWPAARVWVGGWGRCLSGRVSVGAGGVARPERALHQDAVDPAPMLVADGGQHAGMAEAVPGMEADRGDVGAVADDRHHLPEARRLAAPDQFGEEPAADAGALPSGREIDRVLDRVAVGR